MTARISPARKFSRGNARSRASWRALSARSRDPNSSHIRGAHGSRRACGRPGRGGQTPSLGATALDLQRALNARLPVDLGAIERCALCRVVQSAVRRGVARVSLLDRIRRSSARFSAAMPGSGDATSMRKRCKPVRGSSWGRTTSRRSRAAARACPWSERAARPKGTTRTILRCDCREIHLADWTG